MKNDNFTYKGTYSSDHYCQTLSFFLKIWQLFKSFYMIKFRFKSQKHHFDKYLEEKHILFN